MDVRKPAQADKDAVFYIEHFAWPISIGEQQ